MPSDAARIVHFRHKYCRFPDASRRLAFRAWDHELAVGAQAMAHLHQGLSQLASCFGGPLVTLRSAFPIRDRSDENSCPRRGDRRRRGRRQHALSPGAQGLVGRRAARALRAHRRIDLARGGPAAALQHELHGRAAAQVLGGPLQAPAGRNRTGRELPRHRQSAPRDLPRPHGRVSEVLRHGEHHRRAVPDHHAPQEVQEALAAGRARQRRRHARTSSARSTIPTTATSRRRT